MISCALFLVVLVRLASVWAVFGTFYDFFLLLVSYDHEPDHLWREEKELHARQFAANLLKESCEMRLE